MRRTLSRAAALASLALGSAALAQPPQNLLPQPRVSVAFPAGAQAGTATTVTVTGTDVDEPASLLFSHPGITAEEIVAPEPKPDPKQKKQRQRGRRRNGPPSASVRFKVTVPGDVPPGQYDVRLVNHWGVSNPRAFVVGDRREVEELEPNDDALTLDPSAVALAGGPTVVPGKNSPRAQRVELGTTVNGVIGSPTDVDYVIFAGKAGQRVLISCLASSIDSKARPQVEVYTPDGRRLGLNRNYKDNDALLDVTLPADGDYYVRLCEFAYQQGGPDYFYRLTVGAGAWVDAVFPPVVEAGKSTPVTVYGRNLPGGKPVAGMTIDGRPIESVTTTVKPPADAATKLAFRSRVAPPMGLQDGFEFRLPGAANAVPIFVTDLKVVAEKESGNDKPAGAEALSIPCEVAGRIDKRNDHDFYTFTAKKGDVYYVEAIGEQIGGNSDLYLRVRNEKGQELAGELDDLPNQEVLHPVSFFNRHGDPPAYRFTAPADGKYVILVGSNDASVSYGPRCAYRLRVAPPRPDFRAVVMADAKGLPAALTAHPEGEVAYDVYVHRSNGFLDPVTITAESLPPGVTVKPSVVSSRLKWGTLVLSVSDKAKEFTGPIRVVCTATVAGKPVKRDARPATITWGVPQQQNVPTITRLDQQLVFAVRPHDKAVFRLAADLKAAKVKTRDKKNKEAEEKLQQPIFVKPGDKLTVPVSVKWQSKDARANPVTVSAEPLEQNKQNAPVTVNNNQPVSLAKDKNTGTVPIDVKRNAPPGTYVIVLRGEAQITFLRDPEDKNKKSNVVAQAFAEPIEITVLPTTLAKVSVQAPQLKLGQTAELTVRVDRQFDYDGPFEVSLTFPKNAKGVSAKAVTLPAGKDEVKVPITVAKDAKPGGLGNVVVEVVATVHKKFPIAHEAKANLNITK